mgnify:CR=1 FL=1
MPANYQHAIEKYMELFKTLDIVFHDIDKASLLFIKMLKSTFPAPVPDDADFLIHNFKHFSHETAYKYDFLLQTFHMLEELKFYVLSPSLKDSEKVKNILDSFKKTYQSLNAFETVQEFNALSDNLHNIIHRYRQTGWINENISLNSSHLSENLKELVSALAELYAQGEEIIDVLYTIWQEHENCKSLWIE